MTAPHQPSPQPPASNPLPPLAEVIDIRDWLSRQAGGIPDTRDHVVTWLHQRIAAVAEHPEVLRLARLADYDQHRQQFAALLTDAIGASSELRGVELFDRYAHDESFRAELTAVAGCAAFIAVRADRGLPTDQYLAAAVVPTSRQRHLVKAIEDHAPRYHAARLTPARYIAEAHVPGGASRSEWDWIAYHIAARPDVLHGPVLSVPEVHDRDRAAAQLLDRQAFEAFTAGEPQRALDLIDEAELHNPDRDWDPIRAHIRHHSEPREPAPPSEQPGSPGGAAFPTTATTGPAAPAAPSAPHPSAPTSPAEAPRRGAQR